MCDPNLENVNMLFELKNYNLRACEHVIELKTPNLCKGYEHPRTNMITNKNM